MSPLTSGTDPIALANLAQGRAIRPGISVWVTASAGSGKTKVLTERVLALLLSETLPQRILCLTFTKAAAAEMSNRINNTLAGWVTADDEPLLRHLIALVPALLDGADLKQTQRIMERARRLFAQVLDAPGGLQISTLHAFCQSLLRRFPIEARVPPHFDLMDERDAGEALDRALEETIAHARTGDDTALAAALQILTSRVHELHFTTLMASLVAGRTKLKRQIDEHGGLEPAIAAMYIRLGATPGETEDAVIAAACMDSAFECQAVHRIAAALHNGTPTDAERGRAMSAWLASPAERSGLFVEYSAAFLTQSGSPRKTLASKKVVELHPDAADIMQAEALRLQEITGRLKAIRVAEGTAALMRIGARVLDIYDEEKIRRGLMDYDDLIQAARVLLALPGVADWVLYKLDGGIDHILIDEAQDTNRDQWAIVDPILNEFFAGVGSREDVLDKPRTIFAVGDRKQSIYSFQGADPEIFDTQRDNVHAKVHAAGQGWLRVPMNVSFRSTPAVLDAVDATFDASSLAQVGVAAADEPVVHLSSRKGAAGLVEVWPLVTAQAGDEVVSWKPPVERRKGDSPQNRLAALIAGRIRKMIDDREMLPSRGRAIRPGDIMVLVRRRTGFVEELVRQLKKRDIAVAGVDRMTLTDQIAIMDLIALGQFLLLPEDDLTLATILKSPLLGLTEDELFELAHDRGKKHLWDVLSEHAGRDTRFGAAQAYLADLLAKTDYLAPADLYAHVLIALQGRRKLLARLGIDADDPIDEFMNLALAYQNAHPPSLQGFLHWLAASDTEIKRDLEQSGGDAVRVITVHGAKGLQAPIVILPDTAQVPTLRDSLLWTRDETPLLLWCAKSDELDPVTANLREVAKEAQSREYHRLLYVAMTRAEDRLFVCGWQGQRSASLDDSWYGLIKAGVESLPQTESLADGDIGDILRLSSAQEGNPKPDTAAAPPASTAPLPAWALKPPVAEITPPRPLAPSRAITEPAALSPLKDDGKQRYQRGLIIHRLLQSLPDLPPQRRRAAAEAFVARPAWGLAAAAAAAIVAETLAVLDNPAFAPLFAPGSRAEVSLSGLVGKHVISAQVDRLTITPSEVWIIDYKTNRPPPQETAKVDTSYLFQMATYRAALQMIYPQHTIRCVLLWTDGPFTMELEPARMDAVLQSLGLDKTA